RTSISRRQASRCSWSPSVDMSARCSERGMTGSLGGESEAGGGDAVGGLAGPVDHRDRGDLARRVAGAGAGGALAVAGSGLAGGDAVEGEGADAVAADLGGGAGLRGAGLERGAAGAVRADHAVPLGATFSETTVGTHRSHVNTVGTPHPPPGMAYCGHE